MENALQEAFRTNFVHVTELFPAILDHCFSSHQINIYDENFKVILQDCCHRRRRNNSSLLQTDQNAESYALLELVEYVQAMHGGELSAYEFPEPDRRLLQLASSSTEATEIEQMVVACEVLQAALARLNAEQRTVFNTLLETVHYGLTSDNIWQPLSVVPSYPNA